ADRVGRHHRAERRHGVPGRTIPAARGDHPTSQCLRLPDAALRSVHPRRQWRQQRVAVAGAPDSRRRRRRHEPAGKSRRLHPLRAARPVLRRAECPYCDRRRAPRGRCDLPRRLCVPDARLPPASLSAAAAERGALAPVHQPQAASCREPAWRRRVRGQLSAAEPGAARVDCHARSRSQAALHLQRRSHPLFQSSAPVPRMLRAVGRPTGNQRASVWRHRSHLRPAGGSPALAAGHRGLAATQFSNLWREHGMNTILVTGGAGYIGSHVVQQLSERGERVVVLDNLASGFADAVRGAELVVGNVGDQALVSRVLAEHRVGAVMHFAAHTVVPESVRDPLKYYGNNTCNTRNLLACCVDAGVRRFLFSSTAAVYGTPASGIADEDTPLQPINPYGSSKLMSEMMLRDLGTAGAMQYVILRYFNVAGCDPQGRIGQSTPNATLLLKVACEHAVGKRPGLAIFGTDYDTPDGTG